MSVDAPATASQSGTMAFSADDFAAGLLAGIVLQGKSMIPIGHPGVEDRFRDIVDYLVREALQASRRGEDEKASEILDVLEEIRPDPNSGLLEGFWATFRRQQPGRAAVPNPSYRYLQLRLGKNDARKFLSSLPEWWRSLIDRSTELLISAL